jgi:hypothetical protein
LKKSQESLKKPVEKKKTQDKLAEVIGAKSNKKKKGLGGFFKNFFG